MRLDKYLSHTGFGSRKEVKDIIKKKRVMLNDVVVRDGKQNINENTDIVKVDGEVIIYQKFHYYMLNKPKNVISATEDREHRTVIDLISSDDYVRDIFPVGRLDKDTTGLLLLTNDGGLSHELLSPKKKVPKLYKAEVDGIMTEEDVSIFLDGVLLDSKEQCLPAKLTILASDLESNKSTISLEIVEGKYHQVKRMVEAVGKKVVELERLEMGGLELDTSLKRGQYRPLSDEEVSHLKKLTEKKK